MDISRAGQALLRSRWLATAPFHHIQPRSGPQFFARTLSSWHNPSGQYVLRTSSASRSYSQQAAASITPEDNEKPSEPSNRHESSRTAGTTTTSSSAPTLQAQQQKGSPVKLEDRFSAILDGYDQPQSSAQQARDAFDRSQQKKPKVFENWAKRLEPKREFEQQTHFDNELKEFLFNGNGRSSRNPGPLSPEALGKPVTHLDYSIETPMAYPRLNANLGRVVDMKANKMDLAQGLGKLDALVRQNKIRTMARIQRFHERPGLKRKRLKSERWRVRFKDGFKHITRRVARFVNQGW